MKYTLLLSCLSLGIAPMATAQSGLVDIQDGTATYLSRIEALSGELSDELHTTVQPLQRKDVVAFLKEAQQQNLRKGWSNTDNGLMSRYLGQNGEWVTEDHDGAIQSRMPVMNTFYKTKTDFIYHNSRNLFLSVNPVLGYQGLYERSEQGDAYKQYFTAGAKLRATYKNIIGADFNLRYVYEEPVSYYQQYNDRRNSLIGIHKFKQTAPGQYQYWLPTGQISASLIKDYISIAAGYDYQKISDGYRSLILSDFSAPAAYVHLRTKIWKLQYDNLYMRLSPDQHIPGNDLTNNSYGFKYATAHHLSANITSWLNLGVYEMVVFNRGNHFELGYMNPMIFYRAIERSLGSPDKVAIGISAKAIPAKGLAVYGQFLVNEFTAKEFFGSNGYLHNKWGGQLGVNYYDAFTVPNLDLQAEINVLRPYTFQHYAGTGQGYIASNFTNNNLPLAHPLGAGFRELVLMANYRPGARWNIQAKALLYQQGIDTGNVNYGNDLSKPYNKDIPSLYGVHMINGPQATGMSLSLNLSYEIAPGLYFDLGGTHRRYTVEAQIIPDQQTTYIYSGLRLNFSRRDYSTF